MLFRATMLRIELDVPERYDGGPARCMATPRESEYSEGDEYSEGAEYPISAAFKIRDAREEYDAAAADGDLVRSMVRF